ncbi:hypothetical protein L204_102417 [Cryptococcus depauperatus]
MAKQPSKLLQPPSTIISPPSPTKVKEFDTTVIKSFEEPTVIETPVQESPPSIDIDSPTFLRPVSPPIATPLALSPLRSPSPSSPSFRPKGLSHRRTSSTHRVRETIDGTQRNTEEGERVINQYKIGKSLGQGAYAKVELAIDVESGVEYAIKEFSKTRLHHNSLLEKHRMTMRNKLRPKRGRALIDKDVHQEESDKKQGVIGFVDKVPPTSEIEDDPLGLIRREIAVMKKIDHPNVTISIPTADALFLVLEYMPGGTLMRVHVGQGEESAQPPFDLEQTREYFRQLCLGLEYLHANEVVHRDIKPDNVLLSVDRQMVKLCDFGVSEMFTKTGDDRIRNPGGSPAFQSPESIQSSTDLHGKAVDIWALGVTLYCMLTGILPFNYPNVIELYAAVVEKNPRIPAEWNPSLCDLISQMLCKDPEKRITMSYLRKHAWTTDDGKLPMIDTEENLYEVGKHVEEPTQDEIKDAIETFRGIIHVVRAVNKIRYLHRRRKSSQAVSSPCDSANASIASGSMDSYVSRDHLTSNTSVSSDAEEGEFKDLVGDKVMSPRQMSLATPSKTPSQCSLTTKFGKLAAINTGVAQSAETDDVLVESPTSEFEDDTQTERVGSGSSRDVFR